MAVAFSLTARLMKGKLHVRAWNRFTEALRHCKDGEYVISIERRHATRSNQQNRLYWGVYVEALSNHTGYSPDEIHEILKAKFLPKKLALCDGNGEVVDEYVLGGSTTKLDVIAFGDYLAAIHEWAESLGCKFPELDSEVA